VKLMRHLDITRIQKRGLDPIPDSGFLEDVTQMSLNGLGA